MIHFAWPWLLLLLPLPWWVARRVPPATQRQGAAIFLPFAADLGEEGPVTRARQRRWPQVLAMLCWIFLLIAAARPQWLGEPQPVATAGRRLLLAVDISGSMQTQDMSGGLSRLQVVKRVAGEFIDRRQGDQVGLILFGTRPYLQAPLTADLPTVHQFLNEALIGIAGPQTAIGDAIGLAIKRLRDDPSGSHADHADPASASADANGSTPGTAKSRAEQTVVVLLTDGANDAGAMPPLEAARIAAADHLKIYTIGVGAAPGSGLFGIGGNMDLDESTLQAIAQTTGGEYFRATDASALQSVYARIDQLEPASGNAQWYRPRTEWYPWPLALALLFSVLAIVLKHFAGATLKRVAAPQPEPHAQERGR